MPAESHSADAAALDGRYGDAIRRLSFDTAAPTDPEILDSICGDPKRAVHA